MRPSTALLIACLALAGLAPGGCHPGAPDCDGPHAAPAHTLPAVLVGDGWEAVIFDAARGRQARWFLGREQQATWSPTRADVERVEARLDAELARAHADPACVDPHAADSAGRRAFLRQAIEHVRARLPHYRRQYVGLVDADGTRRLLVNAFPAPSWPGGASFGFERWREELVAVSDGGAAYWHAEFDADTGRLLQLAPNGEA